MHGMDCSTSETETQDNVCFMIELAIFVKYKNEKEN